MNNVSSIIPKILIVDDFIDNLRVLSQALDEQGFDVRCAKGGAMALNSLQTTKPDLILLDIKMPEMNGYEVCQRIQADTQTQSIPVVFMSALDDALDKVKAFEVGGVDYITKPFQIDEVLVRIRHQLSLQTAHQEIQHLNATLEHQVEQRTALLQMEMVERTQAEQRLKESEQRLDSILNALEEVVWSTTAPAAVSVIGEPDQTKVLYLNKAAARIYGRPLAELKRQPHYWLNLVHPQDRNRVVQEYARLAQKGSVRMRYRIVRLDSEIRWLKHRSQISYAPDGTAIRIDNTISDITVQQRIEAQLRHDALHDGLTGLPNRTLFMERIDQAIKHNQRHPEDLFAVLFIDLDRFKLVNDSLGHGVGDHLLITIGQRLQTCLRSADTLARLGGDEFTILLEDVQEMTEVIQLAERLLAELAHPLTLQGQTLVVGGSIGIVFNTSGHDTATMLLRDADIAMYRAKNQGKGRYAIFDQVMYDQTLKRLEIESDLRQAVEQSAFFLCYQPIFNIQSGQLYGFEALIRWQHPQKGLVSPADFIPTAEETGLIIPIGKWVLREACRQLRTWQVQFPEIPDLKLSVNLSGKQIQDPTLLTTIDQILAESGLDGSCLRLEITESMLMDSGEDSSHLLLQLRDRSILLSIDDFGTGYSCLSYLRRLPVNTLKVDRSFVDQMTQDVESYEIVRTVITLAHTLGMTVVAEGVETAAQIEALQDLDCEFAQGYFFAKPLQQQVVEAALERYQAQGQWIPGPVQCVSPAVTHLSSNQL
ncbi:EAL domain-containing protein [Synechococcales cyanobacterium C]|uniref:EAL domain-containing protein n=1 Tax=Petrachloros mirabilis ULC683 TaxID=2781853 RepID=A0A8K1ZXK6_9CYAN|nr:EAL domain-containing protein [Petrachloros mirabilis]NCJ07049.1 EAL domain-containing protein [Petrachloros mirabilis ULC683]